MMKNPSITSADTSSSSTCSSVLIHATTLPKPNRVPHETQHNTSGSSFSSTNSQKVRIKAKYLKEIKSPFDVDLEDGGRKTLAGDEGYVPPALPGNRPRDYESVPQKVSASHHHHKAGGVKVLQESRDENKHGVGEPESREADNDHSAASALMEAVNTSGQMSCNSANTARPLTSTAFRTSSSAKSVVKQGAPVSGSTMQQPESASIGNDLRITQFAPTGRQRIIKEQLRKRQEQSGPVKRFVQPKIVTSQQPLPSSQQQPVPHSAADSSTSVAAATAAAVAATVPIFKTQSDLEHKMNAIMEKLSSMDESRPHTHLTASEPYGHMHELQSRLEEVTQLRLKQLERMQDQQMEWQAKMLSATQPVQQNQVPMIHPNHHPPQVFRPIPSHARTYEPQSALSANGQPEQSSIGNNVTETPMSSRRNTTHRTILPHAQLNGPPVKNVSATPVRGHQPSSSRSTSSHKSNMHQGHMHHSQGMSKRNTKQPAIRKHVKYTPAVTLHSRQSPQGGMPVEAEWKEKPLAGTEHGTQTSPLDTPAPRRHAPVPLSQDSRKMSHLGRGLLEEILTSHDEQERTNQTITTHDTITGQADRSSRSFPAFPIFVSAGKLEENDKIRVRL